MKRFLALLLAALMLAAGTATALAEEENTAERAAEVPIRVEGKAPGNTIEYYHYYANGNYDDLYKYGMILDYVTDYSVVSVRFENGVMKGTLNTDYNYIGVELVDPNYADLSPSFGHPIEDTIVLTLSNGVEYSFPVSITSIDKKIRILLKDENGSFIFSGKYTGVDGFESSSYNLPIGSSSKFTVEVLDAAKISQPPYHIQLTCDYDEDKYKVSEVSFTENGTKGHFTVTNLGTSGNLYITISLWDDSASGDFSTNDEFRFSIRTKKDTGNSDSDNSDDSDEKGPVSEATDNAANDVKTIASVASGEDVKIKLYNGSAGISAESIDAIGAHGDRLTIINDGMSVKFPNGFGKVTEPGRMYYPFDYEKTSTYALEMLSGVKGSGVRSEAVKAGGNAVLPGVANITLKTKLTGTINIYHYDENTGNYTKLATSTVNDGYVTFATRQMGHMVLTTGTI